VALHRSTGEAHEALIGSDAHRGNMMSAEATHVGLAALRTERGVYVTQVFATIAPPAPVAEAPAEPAPTAPAPVAPAPIAPAIVPPSAPAVEAPAAEAPVAPAEQGADCITPVPGVRLCGRLAARTAPQAAPRVEPPPPVAAAPSAPLTAPPTHLHVQPGTNRTVVIQRTADNSRVEGYWVYGSGRWWYYPMPPGAHPGQRLEPDLSVSGPPPGFPEHPFGPPAVPQVPQVHPYAHPVQPQAHPIAPPPRAQTQITIAPGTVFYSVPPPPMVGNPDRNWRRAHREWTRAYRRWLREQARLRSQAL